MTKKIILTTLTVVASSLFVANISSAASSVITEQATQQFTDRP